MTAARHHFEAVQPLIEEVLNAYLRTPYSQIRRTHRLGTGPLTYDEFLRYSPSNSDLSDDDLRDLLVLISPVEEFRTTGTRGTPRSIYWPQGIAANVDSLLRKALPSSRTTAIFASAVVGPDVFLRAHIQGFRQAAPEVIIRSFASADDLALIIRMSDSIILFDYPSALARLLRLTEDALQSGRIVVTDLENTILVARLTGEPMNSYDLQSWCAKATSLGYNIKVELRYGCTEFLGIGKADLNITAPVVEYALTGLDCFAEVLDPKDLLPISSGRGLLCATAFRTSGTILFRHLLGDEVTVSERTGERIVYDIHRPDILIVTGNTVSLSEIVMGSRAATGLEICLDVKKTIDRLTGIQHIQVWVHVPSTKAATLEIARLEVERRLLDELNIRPKVEGGFAILDVSALILGANPERRRKAWKLL